MSSYPSNPSTLETLTARMATMELSTSEDSSSVYAITRITVESTRLSDDTIHRHHINVENNFCFNVKSIRELIESRLDIPTVCQVSLFVEEIPLDPLHPDFSDFPNRLLRSNEPIHIFLSYFVSSAKLHPINSSLDELNSADSDDYEQITSSLNELNRYFLSVGWPSDEAVGTRLYMNSIGFLPKLRIILENLNVELKKSFLSFYEDKDDLVKLDHMTTSYFFGQIIALFGSLTAAIRTLLTFSARWEDKMLVCENKFPELIRDVLTVGKLYSTSNFQILKKIGKSLIDYCFKELQLLLSVIPVSIQFGTDIEFLNILKNSLANLKILDQYSNAICLFNLAGTSCVSQLIFSSGIYAELIQNSSVTFRSSELLSELCYRMVLITMHMLRTPGLYPDTDEILINSSDLLDAFISNVKAEEIADLERGGFCFGTLENYFSILYVPSNSIIGRISSNGESSLQFESLVQNYFKMCTFVMEVLMLQDAAKRVILAENLLPHLIIADWKIANLMSIVKSHFTSLTQFPFPTLYDIVAIKSVSFGLGDYKEMMHYKF